MVSLAPAGYKAVAYSQMAAPAMMTSIWVSSLIGAFVEQVSCWAGVGSSGVLDSHIHILGPNSLVCMTSDWLSDFEIIQDRCGGLISRCFPGPCAGPSLRGAMGKLLFLSDG